MFQRHTLVAVIVLAAVVSVFFSPLMPAGDSIARYHARTNLALTVLPLQVQSHFVTFFFSSTVPEARAIHSEILLALNCARLC